MYEPILQQSGVQATGAWLSEFGVSADADGLVFAPPGGNVFGGTLKMSERLRAFLTDLRLLRRVPLSYLVPDAALLPPESIRFFHVDQTWIDRIIDGVFSVASLGTVDFTFNCTMLAMSRASLDADLVAVAKAQNPACAWQPKDGMTGMLIRSELARRWPDMVVKAYESAAEGAAVTPVLRADSISKDVFIALFAGEPGKVEIQEPNVGIRYGVESIDPMNPGPPYEVNSRDESGVAVGNTMVNVPLRSATWRTVNITGFAGSLSPANSPRLVALHLEQKAYSQEFTRARAEPHGSKPIPVDAFGNLLPIVLSTGRRMRLTSLAAQQTIGVQLAGGGE
jgi:hypothetical protein